jgi:hypothetical protein
MAVLGSKKREASSAGRGEAAPPFKTLNYSGKALVHPNDAGFPYHNMAA